MRMAMMLGGKYPYRWPTAAGWMWHRLRRGEQKRGDDDPDQQQLFDTSPVRQPKGSRTGRIELAAKRVGKGFTLRIRDHYTYDVGFGREGDRGVVRIATRAAAEFFEAAAYMGVSIPTDLDWRPTDMLPEDFYAA